MDRVIHGCYGVDPKTQARVLAIMEELDYKPNAVEQALRGMQNAFRIGSVVPNDAKYVCFDFMEEIVDALYDGIVNATIGQVLFGQGADPVIFAYNAIITGEDAITGRNWFGRTPAKPFKMDSVWYRRAEKRRVCI